MIAIAVYAGINFTASLNPYVTVSQAQQQKGTVQIRGILANSNVIYSDEGNLKFQLRDETGSEITVLYKGIMPAGLDQETGIVAIGKIANDVFMADKLLIKCPSKYQGGSTSK